MYKYFYMKKHLFSCYVKQIKKHDSLILFKKKVQQFYVIKISLVPVKLENVYSIQLLYIINQSFFERNF